MVSLSVNEITDFMRFFPILTIVLMIYRFSDSPKEFLISFWKATHLEENILLLQTIFRSTVV